MTIAIAVAIIFFALAATSGEQSKTSTNDPDTPKPADEPPTEKESAPRHADKASSKYAYRHKAVMTKTEQMFYWRLVEAVPEKIVLAQVQMIGFLRSAGGWSHRRSLNNRTLQKSADFLVCERDTTVLAVIELQDRSHERPDRAANDAFKRDACAAAGLRLIEFHAEQMPSVEEIRKTVLG